MDRLRNYLSTSLWALPGAILALSVAAAFTSTLLDRVLTDDFRWAEWLFFTGSPEAAREIFSTIAGSMLTITGVVFSITMLVLQLASSQFSPRALRTFLRDLPSKIALGTFVGTFAYSLIGLSTVRSTDDFEFVPRLTVTIAFLMILTSLAMFLYYIHHTAQRIQVTSIVKSIGDDTIEAIERRLPYEPQEDSVERDSSITLPHEVHSRHAGVILQVAERRLVRFAQEHDVVLELTRCVGSFVPLDAVVLRSSVPLSDEQQGEVLSCVATGTARTLEQDIAYGFRELTDIALRALSPALNDVTTAASVIHAQHDLLLRIGRRPDPSPVLTDDRGVPRLITRPVYWTAYLEMPFVEIWTAGKDNLRITRLLEEVSADLISQLPAERAAAVRAIARSASGRTAS